VGASLKSLTILLISTLAASSLIIIEPAFTSATASNSPSVPEFSLKIVQKPYDVPPTYSFNPYTGKQVIENGGYHTEDRSVQITITNQKFTPSDGNSLMYNVRWKGHYSQSDDWSYLAGDIDDSEYATDYIYAAGSDYTVAYGSLTSIDRVDGSDFFLYTGSQDGEVDIQVQTLIGQSTRVNCAPDMLMGPTARYDFTGQSSSWSNTLTLDLSKNTVQSNPTTSENTTPQPTASNTVPPSTGNVQQVKQNEVSFGFEWKDITIALLAAVVAVFAAALVLTRKRKPQMNRES
jgi:hypothetical protein